MHVGHARGAVFGDALANLLAFAGARGDARILHQRRRRAGRRARPLGVPALPRGARRGDRRDPRGALSRRLSQGASARRSPPNSAPICATSRRGRMAAGRARARHRRDDGDDPRRSRRARRRARGVLLRALADRRAATASPRRSRRCAPRASIYEGRLPPPKGAPVGGLGGPRADAVPLDPVRRRRRPAADEVGRRLHLFRQRHRLSQGQDRPRLRQPRRRLGRRPRRLCQAHARRGAGALGRHASISKSGCASSCG